MDSVVIMGLLMSVTLSTFELIMARMNLRVMGIVTSMVLNPFGALPNDVWQSLMV